MNTPSEYVATPFTPGYCAVVLAGTSAAARGNVTGSRADGLKSPNRMPATALPSSSPGYHASTIAGTRDTHGMSTGPPVLSTTTVRGLAAATAEMSASWLPDRARLVRSVPSASLSPTITTATVAAFAAAAAADVE